MHNQLYCCGSIFWFSASIAYYLGWQSGGSLARCIIELQLSVNVIMGNSTLNMCEIKLLARS